MMWEGNAEVKQDKTTGPGKQK